MFSHNSNFVFMARVWVEQDPVAQAAFNASVMSESESSHSSDASCELCLQCGCRCGPWFCMRTPVYVKQRRQWKQWSRSPDQQPLWRFLFFLKEHEIHGLYNVIRQDLMRFYGRSRPLRIFDATPSQGDSSEDEMLRDAEYFAAHMHDPCTSVSI